MSSTSQLPFQSSAAVTVTTTTETVAVTTPPISNRGPSDQIEVQGIVLITPGTAATDVAVRVRRGSGITGTVVFQSEAVPVTPAHQETIGFEVLDSPGEVAGQVYSVTVQQTAATGNGTVNGASGELALP